MHFEELHQRYGSHISRRVEQELTPSEFLKAKLDQLLNFLEMRAEEAHADYQRRLDKLMGAKPGPDIDAIYNRWREAEELAYLISVADDITLQYRESSRR